MQSYPTLSEHTRKQYTVRGGRKVRVIDLPIPIRSSDCIGRYNRLMSSSDFFIGRLCRFVLSSDSLIDRSCFLVLSSDFCIWRLFLGLVDYACKVIQRIIDDLLQEVKRLSTINIPFLKADGTF